MKFIFGSNNLAIALGALLCVSLVTLNVNAQTVADIEIINQDGEKVEANEIDLATPAQAQAGAGIRARVAIQDDDGKIIVVDKDGNKKEIDVSDAQSIIVNQSVRSIMKDGEQKQERIGKAIIIGPDGVRQEFELAPGDSGAGPGNLGNNVFEWRQAAAGKAVTGFMIGVNCQPVSELLSKQLRLETGTGLVVDNVSKDSPAATAGVEVHDILMFADDRQLSKITDLSETVQTAGKAKESISLTLIRAGKEISIEVTPVERPANDFEFGGVPGMRAFVIPRGPNFDMEFRQMGPGIIMGPEFHQRMKIDIEDQMKEMQEQMKKLQEDMMKQRNLFEKAPGKERGEDF